MNDNPIKYGVVGNAIVTLAILGILIFGGLSKPAPAGNFLQDAGSPGAASYGATIASFSSTLFSHLSNLQVNGNFNVVGILGQGSDGNTGNPLLSQETTANCNQGIYVGSSTQLVIPNAFAATTTAQVTIITGAGQATTTLFSMGTTTQTTGLSLATVSDAFVNGASVATGTVSFVALPGMSTNLGTGQISAGAGTTKTVVLGPTENIGLYATSTATGAGAKFYTPGLSCVVKVKFEN